MDTRNWLKRAMPLFLAAAFTAGSLSGCGSSQINATGPALVEPVGVDIDTATVKKMDLSSVDSYEGQIVPEIKGLYFVNSGNIGKMKVNPGDKVKKGELLATLTSVDGGVKKLQGQLKQKREENKDANEITSCNISQKKTELAQLKKQLAKLSDKKQKKSLRRQIKEKKEDIALERLRLRQQKELQALEIKQLMEDIQAAKKQTRESKLISPVNGEIISTAGGSGYMVQGGVTAVTVADMEKPRIRTDYIGESVIGKSSNYVATVNGKQYRVRKEEQEVSPFDVEMNNYPSNSWFDFVDDVKLKVGDSATIDLYSDTAKDALVVPSNAVYTVKKDIYVYRIEGNSKIKTAVTLGTKTDAYTQILTGLKEGDVVYVQS